MNATALSWAQVVPSVVLVLVAVLVAAWQRLDVTRELLITTARAAAQLAAVGALLLLLFQHAGVVGALGWVTVMVLIAGQVAGRRGRGVPNALVIATLAVALGSSVSLTVLLAFQVLPIRPEAIVPIGGMIVATAMQATGLVLLRLVEDVQHARPAIEARLSLAMPVDQAFAPHRRSAARTALLPAIDSTKVVGLISLPGAMTGLILAGVDPMTAIRYQIVVMYMLLAAGTVAGAAAGYLAQHTLFDSTAQRLRA